MAQQAIMCAKQQPGAVSVIADDTDIFLLLLHHYQNEGLTSAMFMTSPVQQRSTIDIKATVEKHHATVPGCDTVQPYFGIGKGTVLKILNAAPDSNNARKSQRLSLRCSPPVHKVHSIQLQQNSRK